MLEYADSICNTVVFESKSDQPAFAAFEPSFETSIMSNPSAYDVVIVGGGPSGLSAALALGRARRRVLLFDAGPPRNARAAHLQNFVTRDGTPPAEFRRLGREQLVRYASIEVRDARVDAITGERGSFRVFCGSDEVTARRILLCAGMIDLLPELDGFAALWGHSIFQCPYCHGWEVQERSFGVWATNVAMLDFALLLRSWSRRITALTNGEFEVPSESAERLDRADVHIDERRFARLHEADGRLSRIEFETGAPLPLEVLFARPPQKHVSVVEGLGLELDDGGYVQVHPATRETSRSGIYAAGDSITPMQGAVIAAAAGVQAAGMLNHELTIELALAGELNHA